MSINNFNRHGQRIVTNTVVTNTVDYGPSAILIGVVTQWYTQLRLRGLLPADSYFSPENVTVNPEIITLLQRWHVRLKNNSYFWGQNSYVCVLGVPPAVYTNAYNLAHFLHDGWWRKLEEKAHGHYYLNPLTGT